MRRRAEELEQNAEDLRFLTDLHCHILPGMDDGASGASESAALMKMEHDQRVRQIVFTPHFYADRTSCDAFLADRENAWQKIRAICDGLGIQAQCGAEIHLSLELREIELSKLAFSNGKYILLEWPFVVFPLWGAQIVTSILDQGLCPIFAHVERYEYFMRDLSQLRVWGRRGVLCQINAGAVLRRSTRNAALRLIRDGYVQLIASDAHNTDTRPPRLAMAFQVIEKELGAAVAEALICQAQEVFEFEGSD